MLGTWEMPQSSFRVFQPGIHSRSPPGSATADFQNGRGKMELFHDRSFLSPSFGAGEMPEPSSLSWLSSHPPAGSGFFRTSLEISEQHQPRCYLQYTQFHDS